MGERLAEVAGRLGPNCAFVAGDVTVDADRRAMVAAAVEHGGGLHDPGRPNAGNM